MINYKIVLRSIFKEKLKFVLIVSGLATGYVGFLILQMIIGLELGYDTFHNNHQNIFRIVTETKTVEGGKQRISLSEGGLKDFLKETFPAINSATHFIPIYYGIKVVSNGESLVEEKGLYVDEDFNSVFDFPIISGNSKLMFSEVNTIALTKSLAVKYFGSIDVIGEQLSVDDGFGKKELKVTGVYDDVPEQSSIKFDFLISGRTYAHWDKLLDRANKNYFFTYLRFKNEVSKGDKSYLESNLDARNLTLTNHNDNLKNRYSLQPIQETHLDTEIEYDISDKIEPKQIYMLWFISLSIIIITSTNFINTNTIQSASKIKLLGMVKIFGHKNPFTRILVLDSIIKSLLALSIAVVFIGILHSSIFEQFFHYKLDLPSNYLIIIWVIICIGIGLIAGLAPANYLRKKKISDIIKGKVLISQGKYSNLKLTSLTLQLSIVIVLMTITTIVIKQLDYLGSKEVGYNKSDKVLIPAPQGVGNSNYLKFINRANDIHYIKDIGVSLFPFYSEYKSINFKINDDEIESKALYNMVNKEYIPSMGISLKEGNNFSGIYSLDTISVIINESAAKLFNGQDVLNTIIHTDIPWYDNHKFRVIGIMKDFHFESFTNSIEPLIYFCIPFEDFAGHITINYDSAAEQKNLRNDLSAVWKGSGIETPLEFESLESAYAETFKDQLLLARISKTFTILTLFLALFGLFAYLKHNIEYKTKELALRRILGATILNIYYNLSKEIVIFYSISIVVSIPLSFYICTKWLSQFAYHTNIGIESFVVPICFTSGVIIFIGLYELLVILSQKTTDVLKHE